jgi:hypothetical protein
MLHLLTEAHCFVSLPNDCLCQMTGEPMIHMAPMALHGSGQPSTAPTGALVKAAKRPCPFPDAHEDEPQRKRQKIGTSAPAHRQTTGMTVSK